MLPHRLYRRLLKSLFWIRGLFFAFVILPVPQHLKFPLMNLYLFARRVPFIERHEYSQNGEDGMIAAIFAMIGTRNAYFVEFGVEDGIECNTRYLSRHKRWKGLLMDGSHENAVLNLHKEFITAENIESLFAKYDVPKEFDLLSIDIDGNDYWVWKAITHYSPRVVIIEYNACIPYEPPVTIPYAPAFQWDKTDYYGASLSAFVGLARTKGYTLVGTDPNGVNAFFVRDDCVSGKFHVQDPRRIYRPAAFKGKLGNTHPKDPLKRPWVTVGTS